MKQGRKNIRINFLWLFLPVLSIFFLLNACGSGQLKAYKKHYYKIEAGHQGKWYTIDVVFNPMPADSAVIYIDRNKFHLSPGKEDKRLHLKTSKRRGIIEIVFPRTKEILCIRYRIKDRCVPLKIHITRKGEEWKVTPGKAVSKD